MNLCLRYWGRGSKQRISPAKTDLASHKMMTARIDSKTNELTYLLRSSSLGIQTALGVLLFESFFIFVKIERSRRPEDNGLNRNDARLVMVLVWSNVSHNIYPFPDLCLICFQGSHEKVDINNGSKKISLRVVVLQCQNCCFRGIFSDTTGPKASVRSK